MNQYLVSRYLTSQQSISCSIEHVKLLGSLEELSEVSGHMLSSSVVVSLLEAHLVGERKR